MQRDLVLPHMSRPFFSIIIPAYNRAGLISETLDSILTQSFRSFELIVVDDGSTDQTSDILSSYQGRITAIRQENKGAEAARHNGFTHAQGEYIVLFDSDDILLPGALDVYHRTIAHFSLPPVVIAALRRFNHGSRIEAPDCSTLPIQSVAFENFYERDRSLLSATPQLIIRRDVASEFNVFHTKATAWPFEPCDYMLSMATSGRCVAILKPATIGYRMHPGNDSADYAYAIRMAPRFIALERSGAYPGGKRFQSARRAYIGGIMSSYFQQCLKTSDLRLAADIARISWPMIVGATIRKLARATRSAHPPITVIASREDGTSSQVPRA